MLSCSIAAFSHLVLSVNLCKILTSTCLAENHCSYSRRGERQNKWVIGAYTYWLPHVLHDWRKPIVFWLFVVLSDADSLRRPRQGHEDSKTIWRYACSRCGKQETCPWFERDPKPQCFNAVWSWQLLMQTHAVKTHKKIKIRLSVDVWHCFQF